MKGFFFPFILNITFFPFILNITSPFSHLTSKIKQTNNSEIQKNSYEEKQLETPLWQQQGED